MFRHSYFRVIVWIPARTALGILTRCRSTADRPIRAQAGLAPRRVLCVHARVRTLHQGSSLHYAAWGIKERKHQRHYESLA